MNSPQLHTQEQLSLFDIPSSTRLVWHGVNDSLNLDRFLASPVPCAEGDVRGTKEGDVILRHDAFDIRPETAQEEKLFFKDWIVRLGGSKKNIVIDLKEGGETMSRMIQLLKDHRVEESRLWLAANLKDVSAGEYVSLRKAFPSAVFLSTIPLRFMFDGMTAADRSSWFSLNRELGVSLFSISWRTVTSHEEILEIKNEGFGINLYHVNTLEDFKSALPLRPNLITSDFYLPEWNLFGRGSGEGGHYTDSQRKLYSTNSGE